VAQDSYGRGDTNTVTVTLPASVTYTYDDNGNLVSDGQMTFEYDGENQLVAVQVAGSWRSEFRYDGMLRRRVRVEKVWQNSQWVTASETRYIYDGMLVIQERDANNLPAVSYTRGSDLSGTRQGAGGIGGLLARADNRLLIAGDPSAHACYHADGNGNITALANGTQGIVARYLYDPYGNLLAKAGSLADANLYRFSSKELHPSSSLYYYGYRFYAPSLQRWINRDPLHEDDANNLYQFARNAPAIVVDVDGRGSLSTPAGQLALIRAVGPEEAAEVLGWVLVCKLLAEGAPDASEMSKARGKGERGRQHVSDKPWKGYRLDPEDDEWVIGKDQQGKKIRKKNPGPPHFPPPSKRKPPIPTPTPTPKP